MTKNDTNQRPTWSGTGIPRSHTPFLVLHAVSSFSTAYGIAALMGGQSWTNWVLALPLSLSVQTLFAWGSHRLPYGRDWADRIYSALAVCCCLPISVAFSIGFWHSQLRADSVAEEVATAQVDSILEPVAQFERDLGDASRALEELADYSKERGQTERDKGRTCENIGEGDGIRAELRDRDQRLFLRLRNQVGATRTSVQLLSDQLSRHRDSYDAAAHDVYASETIRLLRDLRPLLTDDQRSAIRQIEARIEEGRHEFQAVNGQRFRCPDPELGRLMEEAVLRFEGLGVDLPGELDFRRPDSSESLGTAYLWLGSIVGLVDDADTPPLSGEDVPPVALALVIDLANLLIPFLLRATDRRRGAGGYYRTEVESALEDAAASGPLSDTLLSLAAAEPGEDLYSLFCPFVIQRPHNDDIVLPDGVSSRRVEKMRVFLNALNRRPWVRGDSDLDELRQDLPQLPELGQADGASIYRLRPGFMTFLARARIARQMATPVASGSAPAARPVTPNVVLDPADSRKGESRVEEATTGTDVGSGLAPPARPQEIGRRSSGSQSPRARA